MKWKRHSPERIIKKLRAADAMISAGKTIGQACQALEVSEQTFHRWSSHAACAPPGYLPSAKTCLGRGGAIAIRIASHDALRHLRATQRVTSTATARLLFSRASAPGCVP
jgi:transposase-like protein